ncbi:MAG TPA: hypothetical protein VFI13_12405 [Gemmatimonadales bacterium]|nr:hypothetical protein [Gemmatimonadales bacterium]
MNPRSSPLGALLLLLLLACGFDRPQAPSTSLPVIQGTLVVGADSQFFRLDWATSADSSWIGTPDPIPAGLVSLTVSGAGGAQPLVLRPGGGFGVFVITLPVIAESTYTLSGTVAGIPVSGATRVPAALIVTAPASDTVIVDQATACGVWCTLPYQITSTGAAGFSFALEDSGGRELWAQELHANVGQLQFPYYPQVTSLRLMAMDANLVAFRATEVPHSSLEGAFGLFGSLTAIARVVRWQ